MVTEQARRVDRIRQAARAIIFDEADRLLLFRVGGMGYPRPTWITPGGGLDAGETHREAVEREIYEETGQRELQIGPCVWHRRTYFEWRDQVVEQQEQFFVVRAPHFEVDKSNFTALEHTFLAENRWWQIAEIANSPDGFAPGEMARLLRNLVAGHWPEAPLTVGE